MKSPGEIWSEIAKRKKELLVAEYNLNPNICKMCSEPIFLVAYKKLNFKQALEKEFCNRVCANKFNANKKGIEYFTKIGAISAQKSHETSIVNYNANPNVCLECGKILFVGDEKTARDMRTRSFCGYKCAAIFRGKNRTLDCELEEGEKFHRLTVLNRIHNSYYLCRCECGEFSENVRGDQLKNGIVKSCGCLQREIASSLCKDRKLPPGVAAFNYLVRSYKEGAIERGYVFELSDDDLQILFKGNCFYCGIMPKQRASNNGIYDDDFYIYNGIDRIDNDIGYIKNNVVSCCGICNFMKLEHSLKEFIEMIDTLYGRLLELDLIETFDRIDKKIRGLSLDTKILGPAFRSLKGSYIRGAKVRNFEFALDDRRLVTLFELDCTYCGREPEQVRLSQSKKDFYIYNGIDRVNNNSGYTLRNVVPACSPCNMMKNKLSFQVFKEQIIKIHEFYHSSLISGFQHAGLSDT